MMTEETQVLRGDEKPAEEVNRSEERSREDSVFLPLQSLLRMWFLKFPGKILPTGVATYFISACRAFNRANTLFSSPRSRHLGFHALQDNYEKNDKYSSLTC